MSVLLSASNISKTFKTDEHELPILKSINLQIEKGEAICILGPSGSGKSTLLQILGTLDQPTSGTIHFEQENLFEMNDQDVSNFRNSKMGFVFQFHHLIRELTALENASLPSLLVGVSKEEAEAEAERWLDYMGLKERIHHFPDQLSGGELQRVSIARSLIRGPKILFADEPTGNLDSENSKRIQNLFFELQKSLGLTLVVVTHDIEFARKFTKIYRMQDGQVVGVGL